MLGLLGSDILDGFDQRQLGEEEGEIMYQSIYLRKMEKIRYT